jgi:hypothetical protein
MELAGDVALEAPGEAVPGAASHVPATSEVGCESEGEGRMDVLTWESRPSHGRTTPRRPSGGRASG